jgi:DNA repair protein RecN (Recombination protein N)
MAIAARLVDIHSQTDHLAILRPAEHVHYLDRYAGTVAVRATLAAGVSELRRLRDEIQRLQLDARERTRLRERLGFEIAEIEAAHLEIGEEDALRRERTRLANAEQIAQLAAQAYGALEGDGESAGAEDALGTALELLYQLARLDEALLSDASEIETLQSRVAEVSRSLRTYSEQVEYNPERLQQVDERLLIIAGLKRKYGSSVDEVIAYASSATNEIQELETADSRASRARSRTCRAGWLNPPQRFRRSAATRRPALARLSRVNSRTLASPAAGSEYGSISARTPAASPSR